MRSPRTSTAEPRGAGWLVAALLLAAHGPAAAQQPASAGTVALQASEPRAFGHHPGDTVTRRLQFDLPAAVALDAESLPAPGRLGAALELRSVQRREDAAPGGGTRLRLDLEYQLFGAPTAARVYELPPLRLRFEGGARGEELRVDAWPVVVGPLAPDPVSPRTGLGELRPDTAPPLRSVRPERRVLVACAALAAPLVAYLLLVYAGLPWWGARQRPFSSAYRRLRAAARGDDDWRTLHAAFNQTAGQVVTADTLEPFFRRAPRFAALRAEVLAFYARSQQTLFAPPAERHAEPGQRDWLLGFARACRDAERGSA